MSRFLTILTLILAMTSGVLAQDGPLAFAAVQAPEAGTGICHDTSTKGAISCATQLCMTESGLGEEDCQLNTVCSPAGWSVDIFQQHQEGPHWHMFSCGWQTRAQAEAAGAIACISDWLIECAIVRIWNPQGEETAPDWMQ